MEGTVVESAPRNRTIERPRLTRLLDGTNARIILLVAPAGYGKTTLARQWVAAAGRKHGWYACTAASVDVAALAAGAARATAEIVPGAGRRMVERLRAEGAPAPTPTDLAGMLADDLKEWPEDAWLVVDDYHLAMESDACEQFVAELLSLAPLRLLATTRERPPWVTARRLVYGEILEISQVALALTHDEAQQVLAHREPTSVAGIMALADGWPAVIGLAAHAPQEQITAVQLPTSLYDYCAEELFSSVPPDVRDDLCVLAIPRGVSGHLLTNQFGSRADHLVEIGVRIGFLTQSGREHWEFHPLLRAFLLHRLIDDRRLLRSKATTSMCEYLLREGQWDEVFALIEAASAVDLLEPLIESALPNMLLEGRTETLRRWLRFAESAALPSPVLHLVEAELAFREGQSRIAMRAAAKAASVGRSDSPWLSRAWLRAGHAANYADRIDEAASYFERARSSARTPRDQKEVLRSQFTIGVEQEDPAVGRYLEEFCALLPLSAEEELWRAASGLFHANRFGGIEDAITEERAALSLASQVQPLVGTGFLHTFAHSLVLTARYKESLQHLDRELRVAKEAGLAFVTPHALALKAAAFAGLRRFKSSMEALGAARRIAVEQGNLYVSVLVAISEGKLQLMRGRPDLALAAVDPSVLSQPLSRSTLGEFHATRALAYACIGRNGEAEEEIELALSTTRAIEARVLGKSAEAVVATRRRSEYAPNLVGDLVRFSGEAGNLDSLAVTYRAEPTILTTLVGAGRKDLLALRTALMRTGDVALAPREMRFRLSVPSSVRLTAREEEVLELLRGGMTNREIAKALYITEGTVKVHVRHIFEKLGVRSRTQAALRAAQRGSS